MEDPFTFPYGEHATCVGSTGSGKTFMVKNAILPRHNRFIVWDSESDVNGSSYDFSEPAFIKADHKKAARIAAGKKNFRLRVPAKTGEQGTEDLEEFCHDILYGGAHDVLIYIDEVTDFSDAWTMGDNLQALVRKGRKRPISVVVGSQKPKGLNGWFTDNSAHIFVFGIRRAEQQRFVKNTGEEWVLEVQPKIAIGTHKFAHEDWRGDITIWKPVPEFNWRGVK